MPSILPTHFTIATAEDLALLRLVFDPCGRSRSALLSTAYRKAPRELHSIGHSQRWPAFFLQFTIHSIVCICRQHDL